jgi:hypothetical protein
MAVDIAINVYGKPFQTAVSLLSLERHSGHHINKIYFVKEPRQPGDIDYGFICDALSDKIVVHTSPYWHWYDRTVAEKLDDDEYRRSLRYQYAWEESASDYLFVTHNDVLYRGDIVGDFLGNLGDNAAIGEVGQCWNCPAHTAGLCDGDRYASYRPASGDDLLRLYREYPTKRTGWEQFVDENSPWPLPECRVNEWAALINLAAVRRETVPIGDAFPLGAVTLDVGSQWFRDMSLKGYRFANRPIKDFATHGWALNASGHQALFQYDKYELGEAVARSVLIDEYGISESTLNRAVRGKWKTRLKTLLRRARGR